MSVTIDCREEAISNVIDGLGWLILNHANNTAREQHNVHRNPDESDDYINEHKKMGQ